MKHSLAALALLSLTTSAAAQSLDKCPPLKALADKNQLSQALFEAQQVVSELDGKFKEAVAAHIPEKIGAFTRDDQFRSKGNDRLPPQFAKQMEKIRRHTLTSASYKAEGLPVIRAQFSTASEGGGLQCGSGAGGALGVMGAPVDIGGRSAFIQSISGSMTMGTLCLKGGGISVTSESASKEQIIQFLKDIPADKVKAIEELFAPFAAGDAP